MTPADLRRAERLAPAIAAHMLGPDPAGSGRLGYPLAPGRVDRGVDCRPRTGTLRGDQQRGWSAAFATQRSVVKGQPPDTVDGWAGFLAVYIARGML